MNDYLVYVRLYIDTKQEWSIVIFRGDIESDQFVMVKTEMMNRRPSTTAVQNQVYLGVRTKSIDLCPGIYTRTCIILTWCIYSGPNFIFIPVCNDDAAIVAT